MAGMERGGGMSEQDFSPPRDARYFEDYVPGLTARYGAIPSVEPR